MAFVDSRTSSTGTRPVTPEGASNPVGRLAGHQLHLNQEASQENNLVGETCPSVTDDAIENNDHFQQHCRQQCAQLQATIDKYERLLDDSKQGNQRLIRMTEEKCELKDQEIQQLHEQNESLRGEYIQVLHELLRRNNSCQQQIESITRERQELSEQLRHCFQLVKQSQCELNAERESLWLGNDRLLDQRMTDEGKILQQELDEEKRNRTEAEERSRCLFEENCQLNAMVKELMSRLAELAEVSCSALSPDTMQENLVSSGNELGDLLALNLSEMMTGPRDVKCSEPPKAEKSPSGTQPNDTSPGSRDVPLLVDNPGGGAIPKTKQPWPPLHTVKPDIGKKMEAQPGGDPPLLLPGRHNNRSDQTDPFEGDGVPKNGEENDRAVDHYDAIENNGPQESRQQCANLKVFSDHLQEENQELRRSLKEQQQLKNWLLEENYQLLLLLARQANDVPSKGSSAAVEENNVSDRSEGVEPEAPMQYYSFPPLPETDSEESSDDEFFDAQDY